MGNKQPAQTTQINKVELPEWVNQASQENYRLAKDISGRPLEQYAGPTVAGMSGTTIGGLDRIRDWVGALDPYFTKASGILDKASGFQDLAKGAYDKAGATLDQTAPLYNKATGAFDRAGGVYGEAGDIYRGTAGNLDITPYLNPYTGEVEQRAVSNAERALEQNVRATADATRRAGAFGGSRGEIESALTRSEGVRGIGDLTAQLRKAGLDFATSTAIQDRAGKQAAAAGLLGVGGGLQGTGAGYLNTAAGLRDTAAGYGSQGAGYLGGSTAAGNTAAGILNVATGKGAANATDISNLLTAGGMEQAQAQKEIDALMKQFYERRDYPLEGLNTRLAALGMSPYGKTETATKTGTSEDKGPDWATIGLGALKTIPALWAMSDRKTKTDIEKISDGDIPLYAYRYKSDPKTYPKVVGPMAQDIKKKYPSAVKKVGRNLVVDYSNLMEVLS